MHPRIPFRVLRDAYQAAIDTEADNIDADRAAVRRSILKDEDGPLPPIYRWRDYWPTCLADAVERWREEARDEYEEELERRRDTLSH